MIQVSKTFLKNGHAKTTTFEIKKHGSFKAFVKGAKTSAEMLAEHRNGSISFAQDEKTLYINYLNVPGINKIDTCYKLI